MLSAVARKVQDANPSEDDSINQPTQEGLETLDLNEGNETMEQQFTQEAARDEYIERGDLLGSLVQAALTKEAANQTGDLHPHATKQYPDGFYVELGELEKGFFPAKGVTRNEELVEDMTHPQISSRKPFRYHFTPDKNGNRIEDKAFFHKTPVPLHLKSAVNTTLQDFIAQGIFEPIDPTQHDISYINRFTIVVTRGKDGEINVRIAPDKRIPNQFTTPYTFQSPGREVLVS